MSARLEVLMELRRRCAFASAGFSHIKIGDKFSMEFPFNLPVSTDELTKAVKDATAMYRETWIIPLIDAMIAEEHGETTFRQIRDELL